MFGSKKKKKKAATTPQSSSISAPKSAEGLNSLVHQTNLEGVINADSDFRVDGRIKGSLNCKAKVIIGPSGHVEGDIKCQDAVIEGVFKGNLNVANTLIVKENAKLSGDVSTSNLTVQSGAVFNVVCKMTTNVSISSNGVQQTVTKIVS